MFNPACVYLSESVLHDGGELLSAVGREVQQQGATVWARLQPREDPVRQIQSVGDTYGGKETRCKTHRRDAERLHQIVCNLGV